MPPLTALPALPAIISASYALQRQKLAVLRSLYARTTQESELAARWAGAWQQLVQHKLDQAHQAQAPAVARRHLLH